MLNRIEAPIVGPRGPSYIAGLYYFGDSVSSPAKTANRDWYLGTSVSAYVLSPFPILTHQDIVCRGHSWRSA